MRSLSQRHILLLKLVRELEAGLRREIGDAGLKIVTALTQSLALQHPHLLIGSLELLLLLLEELNLLLNGKLLH